MAYSFNQPFVNYQNPYQQAPPWQQMQQPVQQVQPQQVQQAQAIGIRGKVVSSEEEARNTLIDLDGSAFFFPDANGGRIYTKQINPADFSPVFRVYEIVQNQSPVDTVPTFDTSMFAQKDEVQQLRATIETMQETIDRLATPIPATTSKEGKAK